jgi:hypothetical protein
MQFACFSLTRSVVSLGLVFAVLASVCTPMARADGPGDCVVLQFTSADCAKCEQMQRITDQAIQEGWVVRRFDTKRDEHIALRWQIQSVPTTVLVRNGRELDRILGPVDYRELQRRMTAASSIDRPRSMDLQSSIAIRDENTPKVRGQSPIATLSPSSMLASSQPMSLGSRNNLNDQTPRNPSMSPARNIERSREATVRIRIEDASQDSVGSGTIIDMMNGEALVLTCGHLFRDMNPQAKITVETFVGGQTQVHPAMLIDFQAKEMDIGLIAFRPATPVPTVKLIPIDRTLVEGQPVFSWGCNRGADPTRNDSRITKLNRYLGPANVEVDGQPVEGRSGGGLFDEHGELIGVCYAADPNLREGLYSAAEVVYFQLGRLGLQRLFNESAKRERTGISNASVAQNINPPQSNQLAMEMTVLVKDSQGNTQQIRVDQPSPQLLQAIREAGSNAIRR